MVHKIQLPVNFMITAAAHEDPINNPSVNQNSSLNIPMYFRSSHFDVHISIIITICFIIIL